MNRFYECWRDFEAESEAAGESDEAIARMRHAFYAGALALLSELPAPGEAWSDDDARRFREAADEIVAFFEGENRS